MEDWQQWQIRADQIAADLGVEVDKLDADFFGEDATETTFRTFWPRFRDLKERVRTAPAIRLEDKLNLERRLRALGSRAYKGQEAAFARSSERKDELLAAITELRKSAEMETSPRTLRVMRRDFDRLRESFDAGAALAPPDRQQVWDAWRDANQFAWQRLVDIWNENEAALRDVLQSARQQLERGNPVAGRQAVSRFFELLKSREAKQDAVVQMKAEADEIRREADEVESRRSTPRLSPKAGATVPTAETWRAEMAKNQEGIARLQEEVAQLDRQVQESGSILEQAMLRGTLVDKRRKLTELERTNRSLAQKIEQSEEAPALFAG